MMKIEGFWKGAGKRKKEEKSEAERKLEALCCRMRGKYW